MRPSMVLPMNLNLSEGEIIAIADALHMRMADRRERVLRYVATGLADEAYAFAREAFRDARILMRLDWAS